MDLTKSILKDTREAVGLDPTNSGFDTDLLQHINVAIGKLNQNGIGKFIVVNDESATWNDLQDSNQTEGNRYFQMIPLFITISTKLLFDPPPPSSVAYYSNSIQEMLWRLKIEYEKPLTTTTSTIYE